MQNIHRAGQYFQQGASFINYAAVSDVLQLTYFCGSCSQISKSFITRGCNLEFIAMFDYQSLILPYFKNISSNWQHQNFPWYEEQFLQALDVSESETGISQILGS